MSFTAVSFSGVSMPSTPAPSLASASSMRIDAASEARIRSVMQTSLEGLSAIDMPYAIAFLQRDILELNEELAALRTKIVYVEKKSTKAFVKAAALIVDLQARLVSSLKENKILHKEVNLRKDLACLSSWELTRFSGAKIVEVEGAAGSGRAQRLVFLKERNWHRALWLILTASGFEPSTSSKCKLE